MAVSKALKNTCAGAFCVAAAGLAGAVYDYGFNEQIAVEKVWLVEMLPAEGGKLLIHTDSGHEYKSLLDSGPSAGMFLRGTTSFEFTYTGGISNMLFGVPRNPVAVHHVPAQDLKL